MAWQYIPGGNWSTGGKPFWINEAGETSLTDPAGEYQPNSPFFKEWYTPGSSRTDGFRGPAASIAETPFDTSKETIEIDPATGRMFVSTSGPYRITDSGGWLPSFDDLKEFLPGATFLGTAIASGQLAGADIGSALSGLTSGLTGAASVAPEVGALYSGLDAGTLAGADLVGAGAAGASAGTGAGESGMWEWLDDMDLSGISEGMEVGTPALENPDWVTQLLKETGEYGVDAASLESGFNPAGSGIDWSSLLGTGKNILSGARSLLGGSGGSGGSVGSALRSFMPGGGGTSGEGILDQLFSNPLQSAFNMTPFLLARSEANKQSGDLNNVIGKLNGEGYQRAVLNPYDLDTGLGRTRMLEDQSLRGVSGSSFGSQSLNNYDYMRALGRGDLASKAGIASATLEGNLVNARNTNRNLLLGAGLNASGRMFEPRDPFGLNNLYAQVLRKSLEG